MNVYVEEALGLHVGDLVRFVRAAEAAAKQQAVPEGLPVPGYGPPEAAPIMKDFASRWTSAIEALNKCVIIRFSCYCNTYREFGKVAVTFPAAGSFKCFVHLRNPSRSFSPSSSLPPDIHLLLDRPPLQLCWRSCLPGASALICNACF